MVGNPMKLTHLAKKLNFFRDFLSEHPTRRFFITNRLLPMGSKCQASVRGRTRGTCRVPAFAQKDMSTVRVGRRPAAYANEWTSGGRTLREQDDDKQD